MSTPIYGRKNYLAAELDRGMRIEGHRTGQYVWHTPAVRCSCLDDSGQPVATCRICGGEGFFFPVNLEKRYLAIVSQSVSQRDLVLQGLAEIETIVVSFMDRLVIKANDKIRFDRPDLFYLATPAEAFVLERGDGLYDELPHRVARLLNIVRTDPVHATVTYYLPTTDVTFTKNQLVWNAAQTPPIAGARMPPPGTQYAVTYHGDYDWLVTQNLTPRGIGQVMMGTRALCRRRLLDEREIERQSPTGPGGYNPNLY